MMIIDTHVQQDIIVQQPQIQFLLEMAPAQLVITVRQDPLLLPKIFALPAGTGLPLKPHPPARALALPADTGLMSTGLIPQINVMQLALLDITAVQPA